MKFRMKQLVQIDGKHTGYIVGTGFLQEPNGEMRAVYLVDVDYYDNGCGFMCKNDQGETYVRILTCDESALAPLDAINGLQMAIGY